jgi:hypothetical protein
MMLGRMGAKGGFGHQGAAKGAGSSAPSTAGQPIGLLLVLTKAS